MFLFNQFLYKKSVREELIYRGRDFSLLPFLCLAPLDFPPCWRSQSSGYEYLWMDVNLSAVDELPLAIIAILALERFNNNRLLTEREGRTGEYWPEVVAVRTERSEVRTKTTEGQYSPVRLELARLVSSLLKGTRAMLVLNLPAF